MKDQWTIPRILHQTVKDKDKIPLLWQQCRQTWVDTLFPQTKITNSEPNDAKPWHLLLWDDNDNEEFVKTKYPQYYQLYVSLPKPINRVDLVRYLYMHFFGSIYADMDCKCIKSIESLISTSRHQIILGEHQSLAGTFVECAFMASVPNHTFWLRVVDAIQDAFERPTVVQRLARNIPAMGVLTMTGPLLLTQVVKQVASEPGGLQRWGIQIYPHNYFYPPPNRLPYPKESYVVHMFSGSWLDNSLEMRIFELQQSQLGRLIIATVAAILCLVVALLFLWCTAAAAKRLFQTPKSQSTESQSINNSNK